MKYYIAGGMVRDILLGLPPTDMDICFEGSLDEFLQGNPTARKVRNDPGPVYILDGFEYSPLYKGDPALDALRRDFTINSLILSDDGLIHAHPQAFDDLLRGIIRPCSKVSIQADPIRAFRLARLAACLPDFSVHASALEDVRGLDQSCLSAIAPEQVGKETIKACNGSKPGNFLRVLAKGNCLAPWFPELIGAADRPAGPPGFHDSSILEHLAQVMDETAGFISTNQSRFNSQTRKLAVWMALCHDLGKVTTPEEILPRHIGHEERGILAATSLGRRLRLPNTFIRAGAIMSRLHMKTGRYPVLRPGTRVDILTSLHSSGLFEPFFLAAAQDCHNPCLLEWALEDLEIIQQVSLPVERRDLGPASGKFLRELRCEALSRWDTANENKKKRLACLDRTSATQ